MIISRTPFRVSLFGGGSDYPKWHKAHGGSVLGFAIDKYCYITLRPLPPFFEHRHRIVYSRVETVQDISEIQHPAVRGVLMESGIDYGIEIHHDGDLPARSGLGSSSSFTVGLLNALAAQAGRMWSREHLAAEAIRIEQEVIAENVGSQDQIWATYGGMNRIDFLKDGGFSVTPLIIPPERRDEMMRHCMLFFTGISRFASQMAARKIANLDVRAESIRAMVQMVDEAQAILCDERRPITDVGRLLHESWMFKRGLADTVTTPEIDGIYEAGQGAGALGGKLLGAGGGGFFLMFVEPHRQDAVRAVLRGLIEVGIRIDYSGSKIVVYEPDGLHLR
ncbi:MAG: kinase [Rhodospirillaceae bacterium BRH_c57]|nr:MAG: kinase [Rhodospirillaceae bacterium BRH_c57]